MTYIFTLAVLDYSDTITSGRRRTVTVWTPRQTILTRLYNNILLRKFTLSCELIVL